jgi:methionyl-tRNA formyltransferase
MNVAFAGTPEFALAALQAIHAAGHVVSLVLTQPDRPAGRGMQLQASAVKRFALQHGVAVAQPQGLRLDGRFAADAAVARDALAAARPQVIVVAAYGLILPRWVLDLPAYGCLNIHASLLPRWRGAAPIHRAIEAGDSCTGITIMQMDEGLDTGDMLLTQDEPIHPDDTTGSLHERLATLGARMVLRALDAVDAHTLVRRPQTAEGVSYAHKIGKSEAAIDWRADAAVIERRLRAFDPFPGATTQLGGQTLKCWRGEVVEGPTGAPGEVLAADAVGLLVACGTNALRLTSLQRPGGRRLSAREFLAGHPVAPGQRLTGE